MRSRLGKHLQTWRRLSEPRAQASGFFEFCKCLFSVPGQELTANSFVAVSGPTDRALGLLAMDMLDQLPDALRIRFFQVNNFNRLDDSGQAVHILILSDEHVVYHA